jgi:hypothetical protein
MCESLAEMSEAMSVLTSVCKDSQLTAQCQSQYEAFRTIGIGCLPLMYESVNQDVLNPLFKYAAKVKVLEERLKEREVFRQSFIKVADHIENIRETKGSTASVELDNAEYAFASKAKDLDILTVTLLEDLSVLETEKRTILKACGSLNQQYLVKFFSTVGNVMQESMNADAILESSIRKLSVADDDSAMGSGVISPSSPPSPSSSSSLDANGGGSQTTMTSQLEKEESRMFSKLEGTLWNEVMVPSGSFKSLPINLKGGTRICWEITIEKYDIDYSVIFIPAKSASAGTDISIDDFLTREDVVNDGAGGNAGDGGGNDVDITNNRHHDEATSPVDDIVVVVEAYRESFKQNVVRDSFVAKVPGIIYIKFDNSFSLLRSKNICYRLFKGRSASSRQTSLSSPNSALLDSSTIIPTKEGVEAFIKNSFSPSMNLNSMSSSSPSLNDEEGRGSLASFKDPSSSLHRVESSDDTFYDAVDKDGSPPSAATLTLGDTATEDDHDSDLVNIRINNLIDEYPEELKKLLSGEDGEETFQF